MCFVVNKYKSSYDVYIGRGSVWGNPFSINEAIGDTREVVIEKYRTHLFQQLVKGEIKIEQLLALQGKALGCFCKPKACHGDVLVRAVEWAAPFASETQQHTPTNYLSTCSPFERWCTDQACTLLQVDPEYSHLAF